MTEETEEVEETAEVSSQLATPTEAEGFWCLVANVKRKRLREGPDGIGGEYVTHGTKAFPPGRKLYVSKSFSGDGWDRCLVLGIHRSGRLHVLVTARDYLENFRPKCEYSPSIRQRIFGVTWGSENLEKLFVFSDNQEAQQWATFANERVEKKSVTDIIKTYNPDYYSQINEG